MAALALCAAAAIAPAARPEGAPPRGGPSAEARDLFRTCRAALFYHLEPGAETIRIPRENAEALLEQFGFLMSETILAADNSTVDAGRRWIAFVEQFFLGFGATMAADAATLRDVGRREDILTRCQPFMWRLTKARIDNLLQWRERGAPQLPAPPDFARELQGLGLRQTP